MIEKVIASILDAEKLASEIIADGMKEYKTIIADAESFVASEKKQLVSSLKDSQNDAYAKAEQKAQNAYEKSLEDGRVEAKKMQAESMKKHEEAVAFIVGKVI
ncbi:MAG: hypothetical protein R3Y32_01225 [Bacillota bacterium]